MSHLSLYLPLLTGRRAATTDLKLDILGIQTDVSTCQIPVDDNDATSLPNVFVIGDAALVSFKNIELSPLFLISVTCFLINGMVLLFDLFCSFNYKIAFREGQS